MALRRAAGRRQPRRPPGRTSPASLDQPRHPASARAGPARDGALAPAEEAVALLPGQLAADNPAAHRARPRRSLDHPRRPAVGQVGRPGGALAATEEAVTIRRRALAADNPAAPARPDLAACAVQPRHPACPGPARRAEALAASRGGGDDPAPGSGRRQPRRPPARPGRPR